MHQLTYALCPDPCEAALAELEAILLAGDQWEAR